MGLLSAGLSIAGGLLGGSKESKFQEQAMAAQEQAIKAMLALQNKGMVASSEYFDKALGQLSAVGPAMRQSLLAQGQKAQAGAMASSLGRGLTGTTAHSGMLRGVLADTNQSLANLEQQLAGAKSSLYSSRGSELYQQYFDRLNIRQRTKYDPFLSNWKPGAGAAAGGKMGGMLGGMLGNVFGKDGLFDGGSWKDIL